MAEDRDAKFSEKTKEAVAGDSGEAEVQAKVDEAEDKGYLGQEVDETPRENYTLQGVISGAPTPETDPDKAEQTSPKYIHYK